MARQIVLSICRMINGNVELQRKFQQQKQRAQFVCCEQWFRKLIAKLIKTFLFMSFLSNVTAE